MLDRALQDQALVVRFQILTGKAKDRRVEGLASFSSETRKSRTWAWACEGDTGDWCSEIDYILLTICIRTGLPTRRTLADPLQICHIHLEDRLQMHLFRFGQRSYLITQAKRQQLYPTLNSPRLAYTGHFLGPIQQVEVRLVYLCLVFRAQFDRVRPLPFEHKLYRILLKHHSNREVHSDRSIGSVH